MEKGGGGIGAWDPHCLGLRMLRGQRRIHIGMESSSLFSLNLLQVLTMFIMFSVWNHHNVESDRSYHYHRYRLVASDGSGFYHIFLFILLYSKFGIV